MKIKISRNWRAVGMLMMGLVFVLTIIEYGDIVFGIICLLFIICGVCVHYALIGDGESSDYDVIG